MVMDLRISVDEQQLRDASRIAGIADPERLIAHVLSTFVREGTIRHLIERGGKHPDTQAPPRRREPDFRTDLPVDES
jgi:hypothetical protein